MEMYFEVLKKLEALKQGVREGVINEEEELVDLITDCQDALRVAMRFEPSDCKEFEVQKDAGPLEFTIDLMRSGDYKERFKAEYHQTKIRYDKLHKMLIKAEAGTLDFKPTCSLSLLTDQKHFMGNYLHVLEVRAEIEGVEL